MTVTRTRTRIPRKLSDLQNLRASVHGFDVAIHWEDATHRYHFWYGDYTTQKNLAQAGEGPMDITIYKNLPLNHPDVGRKGPRELSTLTGYGYAVLSLLLVTVDDLVAEARARHEAEALLADRRREAEAAKAARRAHLADHAEDLLEAAKAVVAAWESGDLAAAVRALSATINKIEE